MHTLNVTDYQLQLIGTALARMPYEQVFETIHNLQKQVADAQEATTVPDVTKG